mmetsp:Transcript_27012/g.43656  ORF Transcript_27012/g.43656 Transcript_27012/m.43656 type:complete len:172 (+) Transcript_27012:1046-1561(+)
MEWLKIAPNTEIKDTGDSNLNTAAKCAEFEMRSGFFQQLNALLVRDTRNVIRDINTLGFRVGATVFLNVLFGVVFLGVGNDDVIQSRYGGLLMVAINAMFATSQPQLTSFVIERGAFLREFRVGTYALLLRFFKHFWDWFVRCLRWNSKETSSRSGVQFTFLQSQLSPRQH